MQLLMFSAMLRVRADQARQRAVPDPGAAIRAHRLFPASSMFAIQNSKNAPWQA
ncbi:MAG: hypothetical protein ACREPY_12900 [Rhodanobacteraceae bacterium]